MKSIRSFALGLLLALALVLVALAAEGYHDYRLFWLGLIPLLALYAAAVFVPMVGCARRLLRGALGWVAAAAVGYVTYRYLHDRTDWFRGVDGAWAVLVAGLHAAAPGGVAAAADPPGRGLALAGGFSVALCVAIALGGAAHPGYMILLLVGTFVGVIANTLDRDRRRSR